MKPKQRNVSLSGKTRLTYCEAVALLGAAIQGREEWGTQEDWEQDTAEQKAADSAIAKFKIALRVAGGYDESGNLFDPFDKEAAE